MPSVNDSTIVTKASLVLVHSDPMNMSLLKAAMYHRRENPSGGNRRIIAGGEGGSHNDDGRKRKRGVDQRPDDGPGYLERDIDRIIAHAARLSSR